MTYPALARCQWRLSIGVALMMGMLVVTGCTGPDARSVFTVDELRKADVLERMAEEDGVVDEDYEGSEVNPSSVRRSFIVSETGGSADLVRTLTESGLIKIRSIVCPKALQATIFGTSELDDEVISVAVMFDLVNRGMAIEVRSPMEPGGGIVEAKGGRSDPQCSSVLLDAIDWPQ